MVEKQFFSNLIGSTCPYCQHKIEAGQGLTICPECSTPHHTKCWEENEGCTTFGCINTKSEKVTSDKKGNEVDTGKKRLRTSILYIIAPVIIIGLISGAFLMGRSQAPSRLKEAKPIEKTEPKQNPSQAPAVEPGSNVSTSNLSDIKALISEAKALHEACLAQGPLINSNLPPRGQAKSMSNVEAAAQNLVTRMNGYDFSVNNLHPPSGYDDIVNRLKILSGYLADRADYMLQGVQAAERGDDFMPPFTEGGNIRKRFEAEYPALVSDFNNRKQ